MPNEINITERELISYEGLPTKCPFCHTTIIPLPIYGKINKLEVKLEIFFACPNDECCKTFIGYYEYLNGYSYNYQFSGETTKGTIVGKEFSEQIKSTSSQFVKIYNEAYFAEQYNLFEICGVGYRKALEFLIKDYAIKNNPEQQTQIEKKALAQCIGDYVNDARIKLVVQRAVWIGNDETHYVRKWEAKTLADLKSLIDLTIHWIEMEKLTASILVEMPNT